MTWQKAGIVVAIALVSAAIIGIAVSKRSYEKRITELQNEVARRDVTIEVQQGLYTKLAQNIENVKMMVDEGTKQGKELLAEVKKNRADLASVTNIALRIEDQTKKGTGVVEHPGDQTKVSFNEDMSLFRVSGYTLAPSGVYQLKMEQIVPLKLAVAMARDNGGAWHSYVTTSDESVKVEIGNVAIDETLFAQKWYERFKVKFDFGVGAQGLDVLTGVGASYRFGHWDVGPNLWNTTLDGGRTFYGVSMAWSPLER